MIVEEDISLTLEDLLSYSKMKDDFELEDWVRKELNGYSPFDKMPSYRKNITAVWKENTKIVDSKNVSIGLGLYDIQDFIKKEKEFIIRNSMYNFLGIILVFIKDLFKIDRIAIILFAIFYIFKDSEKIDASALKIYFYLALFLHFIVSYRRFYELELKVDVDELIKLEKKIKNEVINKLRIINKTNLNDLNIPQFNKFLKDDKFIEVLKARWYEANICNSHRLYLSSLTLLGSILEGSLYSLCKQNYKIANQSNSSPKDSDKKVKMLKDWTFEELINVAIDLKWIKSDISGLSKHIKEFRNFIHIRLQIEKNIEFRESQVNVSLAILHSILKDFESTSPALEQERDELML
jgi:hypothetical protein